MDNIIAGVIGAGLLVVFLGFYAIKLNSIPLWIIIAAIIAMVIYNFYESLNEENGSGGE